LFGDHQKTGSGLRESGEGTGRDLEKGMFWHQVASLYWGGQPYTNEGVKDISICAKIFFFLLENLKKHSNGRERGLLTTFSKFYVVQPLGGEEKKQRERLSRREKRRKEKDGFVLRTRKVCPDCKGKGEGYREGGKREGQFRN